MTHISRELNAYGRWRTRWPVGRLNRAHCTARTKTQKAAAYMST